MMSNGRRLFVLSSLVALLPAAASAAEPLPARAERIFSPGRSAASDDGADALALNPANVAFLPGAEARWMGARCTDTQKVACGHVFEGATPVIFGLATGFRVDYVTPPATTPFIGRSDYVWFTWGLAYKLSDAIAFGGSLQYAYSPNPVTNGLTGVSLGLSVRPSPFLGVSLVAHDINRPAGEPLPNGLPVLDRSWVIAGALRPTGRRGFEIGLDLRYLEGANGMGNDQWIPRASVGIDVPHVGRLRGDLEIAHVPNDRWRGIVGTVGLEVGLGNVRAGGGAAFGSGLGSSDSVAEFLTASLTSNLNAPALPRPARAVSIRLESTPGTRAHVHLLQKLWKLSEEPHVAAVTFVLKAEPAASLAHAEELADAIRVLRARGKKVICSYEVNGAPSMYVCASADRTVINPGAGFVRYSGLKSTYFYLGGLLKKIGVKAEIVRVSDHKSAGEMVTNEAASETARADHEDLLREREAVFVRNLALYRHMSEAHIREVTAKGPFTAAEAREAGFVDAYAFDDELEKVTRDVVGRDVALRKYEDETVTPETFGQREGVALLYLDGDMVDGRSQKIPIIDMKLVGSYTMAETIKQLREDMHTKAVVLRIESGGGSSICAEVIWRELSLLAKKKPLIVSMGSAAASGGYYVAAPAHKIYALPLTITGSIGVFLGKADLSGLLGKLGVNVETYRTTPRADGESWFRPYTPEERQEAQRKVGQMYDVFLERVAQGRHMTKEEVDAVGQGRVWTGQQAIERKLVDKLGGLREALDEARKAAGLPSDAPLAEYPVISPTLFERALEAAGVPGVKAFTIAGLPVQVKDMVRAVAPLAVYEKDTSLTRLEWVPLEDEAGSDE